MPEGPEVQIQVDQLKSLLNLKIKDIQIPDMRWKGKRQKLLLLLDCELLSIERKAKYLIFTFKDGSTQDRYYIVNHLAMSGGWLIRNVLERSSVHTRLTFNFSSRSISESSKAIDFTDPRKFGKLDFFDSKEFWSEKNQEKLSRFGPDALNDQITVTMLNESIKVFTDKDSKWEIKPLLMEQKFLAGIGNIYSSEICFLAGINPFRKALTLTQEELHQLEEAIPVVVKTAYQNGGGSTIKTYKSPNGQSGWTERMIYGQKYCRLCKHPVSKGPQMNRSTYWCSKCQVM